MIRGNSLGDLGSLKLTIQKFYRINGGSTQKEGVISDIIVPDRFTYFDTGERDEPEALPWDKIAPANYATTGADFQNVIANSKKRIEENPYFNLVSAYSKWNFERKDDKEVSLNYAKYKAELKALEDKNKSFDAIKSFKSNFVFQAIPIDAEKYKSDEILKEKRERWFEDMSKDAYMEEAILVVEDISMNVKSSNYVYSKAKSNN